MAFRITTTDPLYGTSRSARFRTPTSGVRTEADDKGWLSDLAALTLVLPDDATFSHTTAAYLADLPLPAPEPLPFHVTVPRRRGKRSGIVWHQGKIAEVEELKGFRVTPPLKTWHDLGPVLDVDHLVAIADLLLRRGMVTREELSAVPSVRGAEKLRAAASLANPKSWSPRESLLRVGMFRHGLPEPELNVEIIEDGVVLGTADFAWRLMRSLVDYDGEHHADSKQRTQDTQTRNAYAGAGWRHLGVTNHMFDHKERTLRQIEDMLRDQGWSGPCTPRKLPD